jgi:hypothetical protein
MKDYDRRRRGVTFALEASVPDIGPKKLGPSLCCERTKMEIHSTAKDPDVCWTLSLLLAVRLDLSRNGDTCVPVFILEPLCTLEKDVSPRRVRRG